MDLSISLFQVTFSKVTNYLFKNYIKYRSLFSNKPKVKLLFSQSMEQNWKNNICVGFHNTKHKLEFKEFSRDNIQDYDCVVPIRINDLIFSNEAYSLMDNNPLPIPSKESILLCDDKFLFNTNLIKNGFGEFIPRMGETQKYPYILKKKVDASGENCHIINSAEEATVFEEFLSSSDYFTQKIIEGKYEYATHILFKNEKIVCSLNIKYAFETNSPIKGKDKILYKRIVYCPYLKEFSKILISIGFQGLCCLNYKICEGRPMIIEINPRCGFSLSPYLYSFIENVI